MNEQPRSGRATRPGKPLHIRIGDRTDEELTDMEHYLATTRTDVVRRNTSLCHFLMLAALDGKELLLRNEDGDLEVIQLLGGGGSI